LKRLSSESHAERRMRFKRLTAFQEKNLENINDVFKKKKVFMTNVRIQQDPLATTKTLAKNLFQFLILGLVFNALCIDTKSISNVPQPILLSSQLRRLRPTGMRLIHQGFAS
jgi:hypothetical protein